MERNKQRLIIGLALGAVIILNITQVTGLKKENEELVSRVQYLSERLNEQSNNINKLQSNFDNKLKELSNILASVSTNAIYENQKMYIDVYFEPKELRKDEKAFIKVKTLSDGEKVEASKGEDGIYYARAEVNLDSEANITVLFETEDYVRQQVLEPININEMFAFGVEGHWGANVNWMDAEENEITITITPQSEISKNFNIKPEKMELIIYDWAGRNVGSESMNEVNLGTYGDIYRCKLSKYFDKEGGYNAVLEMTTEEGIKYSSKVGGFDIYENGDVEYRTEAHTIYPSW